MPKVSDDFVLDRFYELFAKMPAQQREGIIRGLETTSRVMAHAPKASPMNGEDQLLLAAIAKEDETEDSQDD